MRSLLLFALIFQIGFAHTLYALDMAEESAEIQTKLLLAEVEVKHEVKQLVNASDALTRRIKTENIVHRFFDKMRKYNSKFIAQSDEKILQMFEKAEQKSTRKNTRENSSQQKIKQMREQFMGKLRSAKTEGNVKDMLIKPFSTENEAIAVQNIMKEFDKSDLAKDASLKLKGNFWDDVSEFFENAVEFVCVDMLQADTGIPILDFLIQLIAIVIIGIGLAVMLVGIIPYIFIYCGVIYFTVYIFSGYELDGCFW